MALYLTVEGAARRAAGTLRFQDIDGARLGSGRAGDPPLNAEGNTTVSALAAPITDAVGVVAGVLQHPLNSNSIQFTMRFGNGSWSNANEVALLQGSTVVMYESGLTPSEYAKTANVALILRLAYAARSSEVSSSTYGDQNFVIETIDVDRYSTDDAIGTDDQIAYAGAGEGTKKTTLKNALGKAIGGVSETTPANDDKIAFSDTSDGGALKRADISDIGAGLIPAGVMLDFAGATPPTGWLICDGRVVSRSTYAALFGVIGTTYGGGDGSTTFNLPNLIGRVTAGAGNGALGNRALGSAVGTAQERLSATQMPLHNHAHSHQVPYQQNEGADANQQQSGFVTRNLFARTAQNLITDQDSTNAGNARPAPVSRIQPTTFVNKIIKT